MKNMTKYQITIGYRAVITVEVKASDEKEAKAIALQKFTNRKDKFFGKGIFLADDNYKADGIVDMDATWNMYDK
jgi:hypothetical protein